MINKKEAMNQLKSMKPFSFMTPMDRVIKLYSKTQIEFLINSIYYEDIKK